MNSVADRETYFGWCTGQAQEAIRLRKTSKKDGVQQEGRE